MFKIELSRRAERNLEQLDTATMERVIIALREITGNPFMGRNIKKLKGNLAGKYRLRVGRIRVIYMALEENIISIDDIAYRGNIY